MLSREDYARRREKAAVAARWRPGFRRLMVIWASNLRQSTAGRGPLLSFQSWDWLFLLLLPASARPDGFSASAHLGR